MIERKKKELRKEEEKWQKHRQDMTEARGVNLASLENELDNALMVQGLLIVMVINAPSVRSKTLTKLGKVVDNEAHIAATLEDRIGT